MCACAHVHTCTHAHVHAHIWSPAELPHLYGSLKRGAVLPAAFAASCAAFATHHVCMEPLAIEQPPTLRSPPIHVAHLLLAAPIGLLAAAVAHAFVRLRLLLAIAWF